MLVQRVLGMAVLDGCSSEQRIGPLIGLVWSRYFPSGWSKIASEWDGLCAYTAAHGSPKALCNHAKGSTILHMADTEEPARALPPPWIALEGHVLSLIHISEPTRPY